MMESDYTEYCCSVCKKEVKNVVLQCTTCVKFFFHPGCATKHRTYRGSEIVKCEGPFAEIISENNKAEMKKATASSGRERVGSVGSAGLATAVTGSVSKQSSVDMKVDWLIKTVKEMKDEAASKNEIKRMITQIVREELKVFMREFEEIKGSIREKSMDMIGSGQRSYSEAVKDKKKESILIIKPKMEQESEATKQVIKEKIDVTKLAVGITKLRKGGKGSVILGCESEGEVKKLKETICEKMGEDFEIMETRKIKPKIKVINVGEEEMKLNDRNLIDTITKQNKVDDKEEGFYLRVVKRIIKEGKKGNTRVRGGNNEEGSLILEADEVTHDLMLKKEKINIGWRKCRVFNHYSVRRCFKCWGYYHIAKNCTRQDTCHKCAGNHKASECIATKKRCVNCMFKIRTYNLKISDEHDALSVECPTFIRALEEEKKRIGWDSSK